MGGAEFCSNGIHLNVIEAAADPAEESWYNLHAIDDVVRDVVETHSHLVISALCGDAAAGGVPFALAADQVVAREDVVLNPYYRHMGGLYGSEYWTYLLPRRIGDELTARLTRDVPAGRGAPGGRDRPDRLHLRRHDLELPGPAPRPRRAARPPSRARHWLEEKRRERVRSTSRLEPLEPYRTEELARSHDMLLRTGPQLPRGAPPLRPQARRALRRGEPQAPARPVAQPAAVRAAA